MKPLTLATLLRECCYLDWASQGSTIQAQNAGRIVEFFGPASHPRVINAHAIDRLVAWLRASGPSGRGYSNATINRYLSALRVMLKRAQRMGAIDALPLFPEGRQLREAEPRDLVLQPQWIEALLAQLEPRDQELVVFLRYQACRVSEALNLTWDRVTPRHVQFVQTKGKRPRRVPLFPPAAEVLKRAVDAKQVRPFPTQYERFRQAYRAGVAQACEQLGLDSRTEQQWTIHTLRHTRLTELAAEGWNAPALQAMAGHASLSVTQRYVHASAVNLDALVCC